MSKILIIFIGLLFLGVCKDNQVRRDSGSVSTAVAPKNDPFPFLTNLRNMKPEQIQAQADAVISLLNAYLSAPENQAYIKNVTERAHSLLRLVNMRPIRNAAVKIVDQVFSSLTSLQSSLISKLKTLTSSNDPIKDLKNLLNNTAVELVDHFEAINNTVQGEFNEFRERNRMWMRFERKEIIADVQLVLGFLISDVRTRILGQVNQYLTVSKVLSLQHNILSPEERGRLERTIKKQAHELARDLNGLNITNIHGITTRAIDVISMEVDNIADWARSIAYIAFTSENPGSVINERLLSEIQINLGQRIVDFQKNIERNISKFVRDTLNSLNIKNVSGTNIGELLQTAKARIHSRINEIASVVRRVWTL